MMRARPSSLETKLIALSLISAGLIAGVNETQAAGEINGRQFWTEITNVCTQTQIEHGALKSGYSETAVNEYCACYSEKLRAKLAGSATQLQDLIDRKDRKAADRFLQSESAKKLAAEAANACVPVPSSGPLKNLARTKDDDHPKGLSPKDIQSLIKSACLAREVEGGALRNHPLEQVRIYCDCYSAQTWTRIANLPTTINLSQRADDVSAKAFLGSAETKAATVEATRACMSLAR